MFLVFDIGGTKMRLAVSRDGKELEHSEKVPTPPYFDHAIAEFSKQAQKLCGGEKPTKAAGGVAGTFNAEKSKLIRSPHLPAWVDKPLKKAFEQVLQCPVSFENDAAMAGLGEARRGVGKGYQIIAYITVSTGVGGARIVENTIDRSVAGFEPGHQVIDADGNLCPECAKPGDLENYISGTAVERRFKQKPKDITDPAVWNQLADWLAYGLLNTAVHWSPDVIVLGGSMITGSPAIPLSRTSRKLGEIMKAFPKIPKIIKAGLQDNGGLIGSLEYLKR